jgi:outer membrane protein TolC
LAAFYRAAHAQEIRRLTDEATTLAEEAVRAAQARYEAGDTAVLDVNVARVEQARARREQLAAASRFEGAVAELRKRRCRAGTGGYSGDTAGVRCSRIDALLPPH